jgi:hypothetical protein
MMKKKDWILIVLNCSEDKTLSPVQLQKSLFLLKHMNPDTFSNNFYNFLPYHYGPFCLNIYEDADLLKFNEMININVNTIERWNIYSITDKGIKYVDNLKKQITPELYNYALKIVKWVKNKSFSQLINEIYKQFPEFKVNSVFKGSI